MTKHMLGTASRLRRTSSRASIALAACVGALFILLPCGDGEIIHRQEFLRGAQFSPINQRSLVQSQITPTAIFSGILSALETFYVSLVHSHEFKNDQNEILNQRRLERKAEEEQRSNIEGEEAHERRTRRANIYHELNQDSHDYMDFCAKWSSVALEKKLQKNCTLNLMMSDADPEDGSLNQEEFAKFVSFQMFGNTNSNSNNNKQPKRTEETTHQLMGAFKMLPGSLVMAFHDLACRCLQNGGNKDCCLGENAMIPLSGMKEDTCSRVNKALDSLCQSRRMPNSSEL